MAQLIYKDALVAELKKRISDYWSDSENTMGIFPYALEEVIKYIDTLEVIDPYEQRVQYDSIKGGIQAHAETYSFNIESQLFPQLTKEQQALWKKEIEQSCISGSKFGVELARDIRYKENVEVKEVDFGTEVYKYIDEHFNVYDDGNQTLQTKDKKSLIGRVDVENIAKHFFELGMQVSNKAQKGEKV